MSIDNDNQKMKLAWQTAFELRTCPDNEILHASELDDNLNKHLAICHVCREKREMTRNEQNAWKSLREKFTSLAMKPGIGTDKQVGQVWTIKKDLGGWREDGRFIRPPSVLLLDKVDGTSGWRVAQLFGDRHMMGSGDVQLDDQYGFAEAWNCYSLKDDRFEKCLGRVKPEELKQVVTASMSSFEPTPEGSILSFFRSMEIDVGAFVAVPAVVEMVEEWEAAQEKAFELIPGLKLALDGAKGFVLDITADTLDLLRGTFRPVLVLRGSATKPVLPKLSDEQKKLIQEHCPVVPVDMKIVGDTLTVTLKWLVEKPVDLPSFGLILDGTQLDSFELSHVGRDVVIIKCKDVLVTNKNIQNIQLVENGETILIKIEG